MKRLCLSNLPPALFLLALGAFANPLTAQETPTPAGHWEGAIMVPGAPIEINVDLMVDADGIWSADISIPAQMAEDFPLADVKVEGKAVSFRMADVPGDPSFMGTLSDDGKTISGPFTQSGGEFEFTLARKDP